MPRLTPARAASAERPPPWIKAARARRESWCLSVLHISTWTHLWPRDRCYRQAEHLVVLKMHNVTKKGTISRKNKTNIPAISERKNKKKIDLNYYATYPPLKCALWPLTTHTHTQTQNTVSIWCLSLLLTFLAVFSLPSRQTGYLPVRLAGVVAKMVVSRSAYFGTSVPVVIVIADEPVWVP